MKKTLIALTLAALPVASMAEVTLYGTIKGGLEVTKTKGSSNTVTNINDWDSFIGFKGEEQLGDTGLKAIWQVEQAVSLDHNAAKNGKWADRTSFIGLATPVGEVRAGYLGDAFQDNMQDLNFDSSKGVRALNHWARVEQRWTGVRYDTPDLGGFSANVLFSPEDNGRYDQAREIGVQDLDNLEGVAHVVNGLTENNRAVSVGLGYKAAGFFAKYGYTNVKGADGDAHVHRILGGYDDNNIFAGLGFQHTKGWNDDPFYVPYGRIQTKEIVGSFAYSLGNITPRLSVAYGFDEKVGSTKVKNSKYLQAVLGVDYDLTKRTRVISSFGWLKEGSHKSSSIISDALVPSLGTAYFLPPGDDSKQQAYSFGLGLQHKF